MKNWIRNHPNLGAVLGLLIFGLFVTLCILTNGYVLVPLLVVFGVSVLFIIFKQAIKDFL